MNSDVAMDLYSDLDIPNGESLVVASDTFTQIAKDKFRAAEGVMLQLSPT